LALSVGLAFGLATANAAEAVTAGQTVSATSNAHGVSWATPTVQTKHAEITNSGEASTASSVITLKDKAAPTEYKFTLSVPTGATVAPQMDGSVVINASDGQPLGSFRAPWAKDATAKPLPTNYTISRENGRYVLTQHVSTADAVFT